MHTSCARTRLQRVCFKDVIQMNKAWYLVLLLILTLGMTFVEVLSVLKSYEVQNSTVFLWKISFFILTILWVKEDLKTKDFEQPFEFSFLLYILWPITFPWYLVSTRNFKGFVLFLGFLLIFFFPWLSALISYAYIA